MDSKEGIGMGVRQAAILVALIRRNTLRQWRAPSEVDYLRCHQWWWHCPIAVFMTCSRDWYVALHPQFPEIGLASVAICDRHEPKCRFRP